MKLRTSDKRGVTLVELMIAAAIAGVIIVTAAMVLSMGWKTFNMNYKSTLGQQSMREAMAKITKLVRNPDNDVAIDSNGFMVNEKYFTVSDNNLYYGGNLYQDHIKAITVSYVGGGNIVVQVDLTADDDNTLSTQISER